MALSSCGVIDDSFGPHAGDCRGGFDLTLLFQESILVVPITSVLLLAVPYRIFYLLRERIAKAERGALLYCKIVS